MAEVVAHIVAAVVQTAGVGVATTALGTTPPEAVVTHKAERVIAVADATVKGNTSAQLNYSGYLVPLDQSRIFKGMSF